MEVQDKNNRYGELIKNLALVLSRYRLYPEKHPAAQLAVSNFSAALEAVLQSEASVTLGIAEGRMLTNDLSLDAKRPGVPDVVRECRRLQIENLTFTRGVGDAELSSFFKLMAAPPRVLEGLGGFKAGFEQAGFEHIRLGSSLFRLVREQEAVVSKPEIVRDEKSGKEASDSLLAPLRSRLGRLGISEKTFDETLANLEERRALRRARRAEVTPEELQELRELRDRFDREPGPAAPRETVRLDETQRRTLEAIGAEMRSSADPRAAVDVLLSKIEAFSPPRAASTVRVIDRDSTEFEALGCHNLNDGKPNGWTSAHSLARSVMQAGTPLVIADLNSDSRAEDQEFVRKYGLVSYLGVPLVAKLDVGVLELFTKEEHRFSEDEVGVLATVAEQAATALHQSQTSEEVKKVAGELAKSNRAREEFLGVISHELRTPLSAIMGYAGMIKEGVLGALNPRQQEALEKVMTRSGELLGLINTMLEATSIETGGVAVDIEEVNLNGLLQELKARYDAGVAKDIVLVWELPTESLALKTDRVKLKHILQNLIRNAIEFTDRGQIRISASCLPESKKIQFKIADTGNGIPADFLPWIFDLFRQADSSGARAHGGVGLGLYIVKKYSEMLGGTVDVESDHGSGSVFTVTLPVEAPARQPASAT